MLAPAARLLPVQHGGGVRDDSCGHDDDYVRTVDGDGYRVPWSPDTEGARNLIISALAAAMLEPAGPRRWASLAHGLSERRGWNQATANAIVGGVLGDGFARHSFRLHTTGEPPEISYGDALTFLDRNFARTLRWFEQLFEQLASSTTAVAAA